MTPDHPFAPVLSPESFLETLGVGEALRRLDDGLGAREPFLLVTGDPGIGKTALANRAIGRWGSRVTSAMLALPLHGGVELLEEILRGFGVEPGDDASRAKLMAGFERSLAEIAARGQVAVIVVDDAQQMSHELLEELRLLVCAAQQAGSPLEVLLIGLSALETMLDDPALSALRQRVSVRAHLAPLTAGESRRYIRHRVAAVGDDIANLFPRKTCVEIAARSGGVPRQINVLAAESLRLARASGRPAVELDHVHAAVAVLSGILPKDEDPGDDEVALSPVAAPRAARKASTPEAVAAPAAPTRDNAEALPGPPAPASHDPREWVARFVGDQGPLQLSSRASAERSYTPVEFEPGDARPAAPSQDTRRARGAPLRRRPHRGGSSHRVTTAALVTIAVIAVVAVVIRATERTRGRVAMGRVAATASVAPQSERTTSSRVPAPQAPIHHAITAPPASADEQTSGRPTAVAIPRGPYTLDTGVHLDLQSAVDERERLLALTGIQGWVAPVKDSVSEEYRVVLGIFRSYERAQAAANMLMRSNTLPSVEVVSLPPKSTRQ